MGKNIMTTEIVRDILKWHFKDGIGKRTIARQLGFHHSSIQKVIKNHEQSIDGFERAAKRIVMTYPEIFIQSNKIAA